MAEMQPMISVVDRVDQGWAGSRSGIEINIPLTLTRLLKVYSLRMPQEPLIIEDLPGADNEHRILRLKGPITISNLFDFQSRVRSNQVPHLIIDLTDVPYIDSAGIGALVGAYVNHQKEGRRLALVGVCDRVMNALEITRVKSFFRFYDSLSSAEAAAS